MAVITVKVCMYLPISWGKPKFVEFRITSILLKSCIWIHDPFVYFSFYETVLLKQYLR